jgi:hypothetical protein
VLHPDGERPRADSGAQIPPVLLQYVWYVRLMKPVWRLARRVQTMATRTSAARHPIFGPARGTMGSAAKTHTAAQTRTFTQWTPPSAVL